MGTAGSPLPHLRQSQSLSQTEARAPGEEVAAPSGLAAVVAAPAETELMMTGDLNLLGPEVEDPALGEAEDRSLGVTEDRSLGAVA